jgi:hypothetical protein
MVVAILVTALGVVPAVAGEAGRSGSGQVVAVGAAGQALIWSEAGFQLLVPPAGSSARMAVGDHVQYVAARWVAPGAASVELPVAVQHTAETWGGIVFAWDVTVSTPVRTGAR